MFLEEKIDRLKQQFPPADFSIPFTKGSSILKSIESKFIVAKDIREDLNNLGQYYNNWAEDIKYKAELGSISLDDPGSWLHKLDANTNYWVVILARQSPSAKHRVYNCKPNALTALFSITQDDFFIVDKKYKWFAYFRVEAQQATIFRGGKNSSPFDL